MTHYEKQKSINEYPDADNSFELNEDTSFNIEPSQSNDFINLGEGVEDQPQPVRMMECLCPKCAEKFEIDLSVMPEIGFVTTCAACNKKIQIIRESCAGRAKRKSYEINCANCGKPLDQHAHCHSCGTIFPDYYVTVNPEEARRLARIEKSRKRWAALKDMRFSLPSISEGFSHDVESGYLPASRTVNSATGISNLFSRKMITLTSSFIVALALIATAILAYSSYKAGQVYAENYIKALYCIKSGVDINLGSCASMKADWESATLAGRNFSPIVTIDETKSIKLRNTVDKLLQTVNDPPTKYAQVHVKLLSIYKIYLETETLIQSKPNSLSEFSRSVDSLNKKMSNASLDLKSNLPEVLQQELVNAKLKYRSMKDF